MRHLISFKDYCGFLDANILLKGKAHGIQFCFYCNNLTTYYRTECYEGDKKKAQSLDFVGVADNEKRVQNEKE